MAEKQAPEAAEMRMVYASVISALLVLIGGIIYFRGVEDSYAFAPGSLDDDVRVAKAAILALPLVPAVLFGALTVAEKKVTAKAAKQTMVWATVWALVPLLLIVWADRRAGDLNSRDAVVKIFKTYTSGIEDSKFSGDVALYGAGSQMLACANEHDDDEVLIGRLCLTINVLEDKPVRGGYREDSGSQQDCFGINKEDCL